MTSQESNALYAGGRHSEQELQQHRAGGMEQDRQCPRNIVRGFAATRYYSKQAPSAMKPRQLRHCTDLPVGALSSHCIFSVRNDVGSVVRDDVVVILSIWGQCLCGTRHWVSKIGNRGFCSLRKDGSVAYQMPHLGLVLVCLFFTNL